MNDFLFYAMIYFSIGALLSSFNYFFYVFKQKNNYNFIEEPGEMELTIFLFFPLFLISVLLTYWFYFIKWIALKLKKRFF